MLRGSLTELRLRASLTAMITPSVGLFGQLGYPGIVRNLNLTYARICGTYGIAGILVGCNDCATVRRCQSTGDVDSSEGGVGGLVGKNRGSVISCRSSARVTGGYGVGGLIGANFGEITCSCSVGAVTGKTTSGSQFGGLAGFNRGPVRDSYSAGPVSGWTLVGGLVGSNRASIDRCYSTGAVRRTCGGGHIGGLLGGITYNSRAGYGSVTDCLWDVESSGLAEMCGHADPSGPPCDDSWGKSTLEMQAPDTFLEAGWDFIDETENGTEDIWWVYEGHDYPRLWWELPIDYVVLVVDDFESYTNDVGERVFETWIDGIGFVDPTAPAPPGNGTGAIVGHDIWDPNGPYRTIVETDIVRGGNQSMPYYYDNNNRPYYAEAERTFKRPSRYYGEPTPQDWTDGEADTLTLHFHGELDNGSDPLYVAIQDSAGHIARVTHPDANAVLATKWQNWHIPLADLQAQGVDATAVRKMIIGIGDRDNPQPGGTGLIYIDDIWITKRMP